MSLPGWDGCLQILSLLELSCEGNPFAVACQDMDMEARSICAFNAAFTLSLESRRSAPSWPGLPPCTFAAAEAAGLLPPAQEPGGGGPGAPAVAQCLLELYLHFHCIPFF